MTDFQLTILKTLLPAITANIAQEAITQLQDGVVSEKEFYLQSLHDCVRNNNELLVESSLFGKHKWSIVEVVCKNTKKNFKAMGSNGNIEGLEYIVVDDKEVTCSDLTQTVLTILNDSAENKLSPISKNLPSSMVNTPNLILSTLIDNAGELHKDKTYFSNHIIVSSKLYDNYLKDALKKHQNFTFADDSNRNSHLFSYEGIIHSDMKHRIEIYVDKTKREVYDYLIIDLPKGGRCPDVLQLIVYGFNIPNRFTHLEHGKTSIFQFIKHDKINDYITRVEFPGLE